MKPLNELNRTELEFIINHSALAFGTQLFYLYKTYKEDLELLPEFKNFLYGARCYINYSDYLIDQYDDLYIHAFHKLDKKLWHKAHAYAKKSLKKFINTTIVQKCGCVFCDNGTRDLDTIGL